jgi:hypothetical protein
MRPAPAARRIPRGGPLDATLHMIIARHRNGAFAAEREVNDLDLETTIADIMSGQVEDVERVIAFNPAEAWSREVTEDIAIEIANRIGRCRRQGSAQSPIRPALRDFIEEHAGIHYARGLAVAEPAFSAA